ncbi:MAG: hypothetical protein WBJ84_10705 [Bacteroidales bacterium]
MNKEIIIQETDQIIEAINEQWEIIRSYKGKIPFIELDIYIDNLKKLYEKAIFIEKLNKEKIAEYIGTEEITQSEPEPIVTPETKPIPEIINTDTSGQEPIQENVITETARENIPEIIPEEKPVKGEIVFEIAEEKPVKPEPVETQIPKKHTHLPPYPDLFSSSGTTLADKFQTERKTIKDQLSETNNDNSIGDKIQQSQIPDLKSAIGINDKFLFINELFKGDLAGYNKTIESLDKCASRQEALNMLEKFRHQFNWAENSSSLSRLFNFLKRRYPE